MYRKSNDGFGCVGTPILLLLNISSGYCIQVIWLLLMISGIEPNPGPKKQTTLLTEPTPTGKKSADTELKTMIVQMSSEIRNLGERIDTRLSNIEKRIIEWDQRLLGVEMKLTTCVETSAATNEKVSENVTKLREIEARTDFLEMKLREPNLVFYGVEGEANEGPAESLQKVKSIIKEKMLILENISITKCHRLGKCHLGVVDTFKEPNRLQLETRRSLARRYSQHNYLDKARHIQDVASFPSLRVAPGFHCRVKAKTSLQDDDVPIDDTATKPLFTPQEKGRKGFHRRVKANTSLQDDDVPIDDTTTKPLFTPQEKGRKHRMNIANEMLDSVRDDPNLLQRVITGDEAWVYGYDVETKAQSSQWKLPHEPRPKKARQVRSNVKVLLTVFFDCRGVVHHEFLPQGRTVNKEYYLQVMRNLREAIRQKRPDLWKNKNWLLHHDNAPAHTSLLVRDLLAKNNTLMIPQPPYSADLAPCDFFSFPKLKRPMKGRRYATLDEIKTASKEELKKIFKNDFLKCFEDRKNRWHKCIISHGDYFEGDKIGIHE
ncbi:hypothetical protein LAZ67_8002433 [Cordylochernes scorpioides]|uniref:Transposase n=1 Tax=Cordylochernes scorpioides TaxID=51811 RepID=A0ABY6KVY7_9ARAC|nr:hypothetical protein LAZ67_8002433 [Cordylochernes scorpioides]